MFHVPVPSLKLQNVQDKMVSSMDTQTNSKGQGLSHDAGTLTNRVPLEKFNTTYLKKVSIEFQSTNTTTLPLNSNAFAQKAEANKKLLINHAFPSYRLKKGSSPSNT